MTAAQTRQPRMQDTRGHSHVTGSAWVAPSSPLSQSKPVNTTRRAERNPWLLLGAAIIVGVLATCVALAEARRSAG